MTPIEAQKNLQDLINGSLRNGYFADSVYVIKMQDSLDLLYSNAIKANTLQPVNEKENDNQNNP